MGWWVSLGPDTEQSLVGASCPEALLRKATMPCGSRGSGAGLGQVGGGGVGWVVVGDQAGCRQM